MILVTISLGSHLFCSGMPLGRNCATTRVGWWASLGLAGAWAGCGGGAVFSLGQATWVEFCFICWVVGRCWLAFGLCPAVVLVHGLSLAVCLGGGCLDFLVCLSVSLLSGITHLFRLGGVVVVG